MKIGPKGHQKNLRVAWWLWAVLALATLLLCSAAVVVFLALGGLF